MNFGEYKDKARPTMNLSDFSIDCVKITIEEDIYGNIKSINMRVEESNGIRSYFKLVEASVTKITTEKFEIEEE